MLEDDPVPMLERFLKGLENLGPGSLLVVLVIAIGYLIRILRIRNRFIPLWVIGAGQFIYQGIFPVATLADKWPHPRWVVAIYAFILSLIAWGLHGLILSRIEDWLDRKGWLHPRLANDPAEKPKVKTTIEDTV